MSRYQKKLNCWEFMSCGRELDGINAEELGVCPASNQSKYNGINNGLNGGRSCWAIVGTLCRGTVQDSYIRKFPDCLKCAFFLKVQEQEEKDFTIFGEAFRKDREII